MGVSDPRPAVKAVFPQLVDRFAAALSACGVSRSSNIAVAVSGGGDSMALVLLLADYMSGKAGRLKAYTVDHGLRAGSRQEAQDVQAQMAAWGIDHDILTWEGNKPGTHVQETARTARYALLQAACVRDGFQSLLVAHHREDQLETFWMRLAHGSGLDGLSGMPAVRDMGGGVSLVRPLLDFSRQNLRDICIAADVSWIEDPTNQNEKYLRPRLRAFEKMLAQEGLSPERLLQTLQKLEGARAALQSVAVEKLQDVAVFHPEGYVTIRRNLWQTLHADIARRVLTHILRAIAPQPYPPGFEVLRKLAADIADPAFAGQTAAGCDLSPYQAEDVLVLREAACLPATLPLSQAHGMMWDSRFVLHGLPADMDESCTLAPLGVVGVAALRKNAAARVAALSKLDALPGRVRPTLPAVWRGENLLSVPHLSWHDPVSAAPFAAVRAVWQSTCVNGFSWAEIV